MAHNVGSSQGGPRGDRVAKGQSISGAGAQRTVFCRSYDHGAMAPFMHTWIERLVSRLPKTGRPLGHQGPRALLGYRCNFHSEVVGEARQPNGKIV